jgi:predicted permease
MRVSRVGHEEFDAELRAHVEMHIEENMRRGMTRQEARREALVKLGGVEQTRQEYRARRGLPWLESLLQDIRFGLRTMRKNPSFTAVAIATLALGIGANTAIFTVAYGTLLRPLPFPKADRIVELAESVPGEVGGMSLSANELRRMQDLGQIFDGIAGYTDVEFNVTSERSAEHLHVMPISANFFHVLGVGPAAGRDFRPEEDAGDGEPVAIVSYGLSVRQFGGATAALGQTLSLNGKSFTVIGAMPRGFDTKAAGMDQGASFDAWVPLALVAKTAGGGENIGVLARLKDGVTKPQLDTQMSLITQDFYREYPRILAPPGALIFMPYRQALGEQMRPFLLILLGATGFVLLIACANVSNLLLARGVSRGREVAVRVAMGASRWRLIRQLLTESMLVAVAGGALGVAVARAGLAMLLASAPLLAYLPRTNDIHLDSSVLLFTLGASLITGALFGVAPAIYATKTDLNRSLKEGSAGAGTGRSHARVRQSLIVGEFALSLVLLAGAGLMIATFAKLMGTNPGFDPHHVLTMDFWLAGSSHTTSQDTAAFYAQIEQKLQSVPGVNAAGVVAAGLPLERGGNDSVAIAGPNQSKRFTVNYREASAGYFRAMGIAVREGRGILESDSATANHIAVINEAFARKFFPGHVPLGEHVIVDGAPCEVVGVTADAKSFLDRPAAAAIFIPAAQAKFTTSNLFEGWFPRRVVVRTSGDPLAMAQPLREAMEDVDPSVATGQILSMDQMASRSLAVQHFMMTLLSAFGGLALLLASVGIYGVISHAVSQRTREIGIRMALGADRGSVQRMVLGEGLRLVIAGMAIGIGAGLMLTRLLAGLIYGVSARDPLTFALGAAALVIVALGASYVPARRAMKIDPMAALRSE